MESCESCKFFCQSDPETIDHEFDEGICRRYPPQIVSELVRRHGESMFKTGKYHEDDFAYAFNNEVDRVWCSSFPGVTHEMWCGEYQRKELTNAPSTGANQEVERDGKDEE